MPNPRAFQSFSTFQTQRVSTPDLVLVEAAFMQNGRAVSVDSNLEVKLFNLGEDIEVQSFTLDSSPKIETVVDASGVYYFVRADPTLFKGVIQAKWFGFINGQKFREFPITNVVNSGGTQESILLATQVKNWVLRQLGWPKVSIELEDSQLGDCVDNALITYGRYIPKWRFKDIPLVSGSQKVYQIEEYGRGVLDVQFRRKEGNPIISDPLFGREYPRFAQLDFDLYVLSTSYYETLLRVTGQEPIARWEPANPNIIMIDVGQGSNRDFWEASYFYVTDPRLEEVDPHNHLLFKRVALAHAKVILGEVREKIGNKVVTAIGTVELNGTQLKEQGQSDLEKYEEDLYKQQVPMWPQRW